MALKLPNNLDKKRHFLPSFVQKIKGLVNKGTKELTYTLSNKDKYDMVKLEMTKENIDEHSLKGAEMLIKNGLATYVVSTIKEFTCDHNDIVDLLIVNGQSDLLLGDNNNMVKDFQVDTNETLEKLYYTDRGNSFRGVSMVMDPKKEKLVPKILVALEKFENNPLLRKFLIDNLKKSSNEFLWFTFRNGNFDKFVDLLTSEEFEKNEDFINRIQKLIVS